MEQQQKEIKNSNGHSHSFAEPNTHFFTNYHSHKDHEGLTRLDRSPFLVVRHALSQFNIAYKEFAKIPESTE